MKLTGLDEQDAGAGLVGDPISGGSGWVGAGHATNMAKLL